MYQCTGTTPWIWTAPFNTCLITRLVCLCVSVVVGVYGCCFSDLSICVCACVCARVYFVCVTRLLQNISLWKQATSSDESVTSVSSAKEVHNKTFNSVPVSDLKDKTWWTFLFCRLYFQPLHGHTWKSHLQFSYYYFCYPTVHFGLFVLFNFFLNQCCDSCF